MNYSPRLPFPEQRIYERRRDAIEYDVLKHQLARTYGPMILYRAMLFWVRRQGKKDGLAYFAFIDMFGGKPHDCDKGDLIHLDDPDFEKWMFLRGERSRRQWRNDKARRKRNARVRKLGNAR